MKIVITTPSFAQHGGIRNLVSWANGLAELGHDVAIFTQKDDEPREMFVNPEVRILGKVRWSDFHCMIIGSPHGMVYADAGVKKKFHFMQQVEHLFRPGDQNFKKLAMDFYSTKDPVILYSKWNEEYIRPYRKGPTHYVGTGVSLKDFPISLPVKNNKTVLVEGWECTNPTKDINRIGPEVASMLKDEGYTILAFSQLPLKTFRDVPDEYYAKPSLEKMNELYSRADILIKATLCDARSASPLEAMTKYTPTARAIQEGDDDLIDGENCLRVDYDGPRLYEISRRLLTDHALRKRIAENCTKYIQENTWEKTLKEVNKIITA